MGQPDVAVTECMKKAAECIETAAEYMQIVAVGTWVDSNGFVQKGLREDIDCSEYVWR
jgi:hypothetical protein